MVSPETARDFVFVDDVVEALLDLPKLAPLSGEVINLGTGRETTLGEFVATVKDLLGSSSPGLLGCFSGPPVGLEPLGRGLGEGEAPDRLGAASHAQPRAGQDGCLDGAGGSRVWEFRPTSVWMDPEGVEYGDPGQYPAGWAGRESSMGIQADIPRTDLRRMSAAMRRWIIEQSLESNVGHIGSALSIVEIMAALWGSVLRDPASDSPHRDRFILAKGHAALALYRAMRWRKLIPDDLFSTYCKDGSVLAVHPESALPGVEVATGSLGQGLSVGCGLALALRRKGSPARVFVLMSDAECNEGQVWEAAMFAAHHRLSNLTAIIDLNGLQAMGRTERILDMAPMAARWSSFGWDARDVDGHDEAACSWRLTGGSRRDGAAPTVVIAHTTLGKGVAFMEDQVDWHYRNLSPELADEALCLLEDAR